MERIEGQPLAEIIARAPLPPDEVARIGAALADAVHSVHAQDVIHLDLKPENFMLRPTGEAVLLDFGFARHARYPDLLAEEQQFAAGSAAYVSPEQLQDDRSDPRSDLFALGVLLYELATGKQPFGQPRDAGRNARPPVARAGAAARGQRRKSRPGCRRSILHCLEHDAAARYQSAAHIALDLRHPEQVALSARAERTEARRACLRHVAAMVARAARQAIVAGCAAIAPRARARRDPGRGRHRASRRRAPFAAAMGDRGRSSRSIRSTG